MLEDALNAGRIQTGIYVPIAGIAKMTCLRCGFKMESWHCRDVCPNCGAQND